MPRHRRRRPVLVRAVAILCGVAAVAGIQSSANAGYQRFSYHGASAVSWWSFAFWSKPQNQHTKFTIHAPALTGLHPGAVKSFTVTVQNPNSYPIRVTELGGSLGSTSSSLCKANSSNLIVRARQGTVKLPLTVPARSTRTAGEIPLYMPNTVAGACQRTSFVIRFDGSAEKVGTHR